MRSSAVHSPQFGNNIFFLFPVIKAGDLSHSFLQGWRCFAPAAAIGGSGHDERSGAVEFVRPRCGRAAVMPIITVTFDNGPDPEVTPFVLDTLGRQGIKST